MSQRTTSHPGNTTDILHHIGLINSNLEMSAACYERLGFTLTPLSIPSIALEPGGAPEPLGAGNRHAIFANNYLELLGVVDPKRWATITPAQRGPYNLDRPLSRYEGLHVMHFGTDHIEKVKDRLNQEGVVCSAVTSFQRNVKTETDDKLMKASTIHFPPESNPEGLLQIAQHETPELVFQERYMDHPNGAVALTEITIVTETPAVYAAKYERYTGHQSRHLTNRHFIIDLGFSSIRIVDVECLDTMIPGYRIPVLPFMAAFTLEVKSLAGLGELLTQNKVPFAKEFGAILVYPEYACGCAILFEEKIK
jgi:hypothetical protein